MSEEIIRYEGDTTTRELWDGGATVSTGVSRKLSPKNRSFSMVMFQQAKPILDSEVNLAQQIQNHLRADYIRETISDGFLKMQADYGITDVLNCIRLAAAVANVQGWLAHMNGANRSDSQSDIIFPAAPNNGTREDLAFAEVFFESVAPTGSREDDDENVYKYGGVKSGTLANDLMDEVAGAETTRRIQLRWNIRTATDVNFATYPNGVDDNSRVKARGGANADSDYSFVKLAEGIYRAGDGSNAACVAMDCVDGYVYALPLFKVHRRNQTPYNAEDNPHGAPAYGAEGAVQRPDGLFHDVIVDADVTPLWKQAETITMADNRLKERMRNAETKLSAWKNRRIQQGAATIYNKFVVDGCVVGAVPGTRNIQVTKTGTYSAANASTIYADGHLHILVDEQSSVAAVPINSTSQGKTYYAYVDYDEAADKYRAYVAEEVPTGKLKLYRITVPAGDTAANLNAAVFTSERRMEGNYLAFYNETPYVSVKLTGEEMPDAPDYQVMLEVESADHECMVGDIRAYDKVNNGFKIGMTGTADNVVVRWTVINTDV